MVSVAAICFSVPLALMLPVLRGRSRWLVAFLLVGSYLCVCAGSLNALLRAALQVSSLELSCSVAPVSEELLKAPPSSLTPSCATTAPARCSPCPSRAAWALLSPRTPTS